MMISPYPDMGMGGELVSVEFVERIAHRRMMGVDKDATPAKFADRIRARLAK